MIDIDEMGSTEIVEILQKVGYGHLGCIYEGNPYVIPMNYYLDDSTIYLFTTEGSKSRALDANPAVCLQVEEIHDLEHWRSIVVTGRAVRIKDEPDLERIVQLVKTRNPKLSPALNRTWTDAWGRGNVIEIYRIDPIEMTGRTTQGVSSRPLQA